MRSLKQLILLLYVDFIISTRARKSEWWEMKAEELQRAADRNDMKGFYSGLKEVWGPQAKQPVHLKSSDGLEIFTDTTRVMARWSEYIYKLLNVPGDIEPEVLENIQKRSVITALDEKPTVDKMVRTIKGLNDGKAPDGDGIPAEQTLKPHYPKGGARDTVRLLFNPKHSRHDLLPTTTPGKGHRAGSTSVYCLCRLHKGIQHRCEDWTMAATEEIWMP